MLKKNFSEILKKGFLRSLIIIVLLFCILILSIMLINLSFTVGHLAKSVINRTTQRAELELDNYFHDVENSLFITIDLIDQDLVQGKNDFSMNQHVLPIFNNIPNITTLAVANQSGEEYSIIREDTSWLNNFVYETDSGMDIISERWYKKDGEKLIIKRWTGSNIDYDPRKRPWYKGARRYKGAYPFWTDPYVFFNTFIPGITVSSISLEKDSSKYTVAQYDVTITDISKFTTTQKISRNGKSFILTKDLNYIGLPTDTIYKPIDSIKKYILRPIDSIDNHLFVDFNKKWNHAGKQYNEPFSFTSEKQKWWGAIQKYELCPDNYFLIGVVVPERDFLVEIKKSRNMIIGGFTMVVIFIIVVVRSYQQKRKANIILEEKNRKIESQKAEIEQQRDLLIHQKEEITDSINYAEKIQRALLPQESYVADCLPEHFILFKPRDIVSGDFYWIKNVKQELIIVAADCTGHGVPGAFMSMLGISSLNEIIIKMDVPTSAEIMNKLRDKVIESLHQKKGTKIKDGMDMTMCILNMQTRQMQFSGANNPVYIVRKIKDDEYRPKPEKRIEMDGKELVEIKADKMPVGVHPYRMNESFTQHIYHLEKGDVFYTFSDGFADQFGGPKGKKFMYKPFKRLLLENHLEPMQEQEQILRKTWNEWTVGYDQIDDIVVIGVRV